MTPEPSAAAVHELTPRELRALTEAAAWYAKYHERLLSSVAADSSAKAVAHRDRFDALHIALQKLGVRIRRPDGL